MLCVLGMLPITMFAQVTLTSANFSTYAQPLENQRLSTSNGATFSALTTNANGRITVNKPGDSPLGSNILISSPTSFPGIVFNEGDGAGNVTKRWDIIAGGGHFKVRDNNNNAERFFINGSNGFVGLGTSAPAYRLDVVGTGNFSGALTQGGSQVWHAGNFTPANFFATAGGNITGNVTIGTTAAQKDLAVNGNIITRRVKVTATGWADYVFDSAYQLPALDSVEKYIQTNKHLPDVPSSDKVAKEGVDVGDNQVLLLKKIEELTLYIIQQNKDMEAMKKRMEEMERKMM